MQSLMKLINKFTGGLSAEVSAGADASGNLLVTQGNPSYAEIRRRGDAWTVQTATALTPLVAVPTTTAALEVYNNGTRAIVVSDLFAEQILATAAVQAYAIYAMISTQKAVPTLTALVLNSLSGKALITPTATSEVVTGVGTTVVANGWHPYGNPANFGLAAATPGNAWSADISGKLIVWPGTSLCLHIVGSLATASTFQVGCVFDMVTMSMEP